MLSDAKLRAAQPRQKAYKIFDEHNLYIEVSPSGGKLWRSKFFFHGKEKRLSLGKYPDVPLKLARERHLEIRQQVAAGIDPSSARQAEKISASGAVKDGFEVIAREWYQINAKVRADTYNKSIILRLEKNVFPWLGSRPIAAITAPELLAMARRIEARGANETAHRCLNLCSQIFRYAIATGRADRDPTPDLRGALAPVQEGHFAALTDPESVAAFLRVIDCYQAGYIVRAALLLGPLVFVRPGELRQAEWSDIDLDAAEWRFVTSKRTHYHARLLEVSRSV